MFGLQSLLDWTFAGNPATNVLDFVTILEVGMGLTHIEKLAHGIEGYPPVTIANLAISLDGVRSQQEERY